MASYHLASSLHRLRAEVNDLWPGRDKTADGWIGDTSHAARPSDHNPAPPTGVVRALDIDKDGMDAGAVIAVAIQDRRVEYVIHAGLIYQRKYGFKPRKYTGVNSHHGHVHISIRHGSKYEQDSSSWGIATRTVGSAVGGVTFQPGAHIPTLTFPSLPEDDMPTPADLLNAPAFDGGPTLSAVLKAIYQHDFEGGESMPAGVPHKDRAEQIAKAAPRGVWSMTVERDGKHISALQELADAKSAALAALAEIRGLSVALNALASAKGYDPAAIRADVRAGVSDALTSIETTVTLKEQS